MPSARPARAGRSRTQRCTTSARIGCACPLHRASPPADALKREAFERSRISGLASCHRRISRRRGRIHELEPRQESSYAGPTGRCHTWRAQAAVGSDAGRAGRAEDEAEEPISSMATAELAGSVRAVQTCSKRAGLQPRGHPALLSFSATSGPCVLVKLAHFKSASNARSKTLKSALAAAAARWR